MCDPTDDTDGYRWGEMGEEAAEIDLIKTESFWVPTDRFEFISSKKFTQRWN